jgi:TetR/AcrR family transcriptional regulator, mexCD-oprJ operon repressor
MTGADPIQPTPLSAGSPRQALQQRVSAAILEAAARVLVAGGGRASMSDVATAAGVARATVYRYFPNRDALLAALAEAALADAAVRLSAARVEEVPAEEGIRRVVRAFVEVGDSFLAVARERVRPDPDEFERRLAAPVRRVIEGGQSSGSIREDVPSSWLTESLVGLVVSVLAARPLLGREDTIATIASVFLDGARASGPQGREAGVS